MGNPLYVQVLNILDLEIVSPLGCIDYIVWTGRTPRAGAWIETHIK